MDQYDMPSRIEITEPYLTKILSGENVISNLKAFLSESVDELIEQYSCDLMFEGYVDEEINPVITFFSSESNNSITTIKAVLEVTLIMQQGGCPDLTVKTPNRIDLIFTHQPSESSMEYEVDTDRTPDDFYPNDYN